MSHSFSKNHQHIVFSTAGRRKLPPSIAVAKAVRLIKSNSSKWLNEMGRDFARQKGYAAFSVSASNIGAVAEYVRNQEAHHRKMTFEEELVALLKKHGVEYDPEHIFG